MTSVFRRFTLLSLAVATATLLIGCASLGSSSDANGTLTNVIGTWTYEATGSQPLSRGTLQLATRNGRLMGQLRDSELGTIPIHADVSGQRLELRMDLFRMGPLSVAGSVEGDEFRALIDRPTYNVTMDANEASAHQRDVYGSFEAERRVTSHTPQLVLNCPQLGPDGIVSCK
jgi:hypothetical protein